MRVDIIPWIHDPRFEEVKGAVELIKKMPKNSRLAFEAPNFLVEGLKTQVSIKAIPIFDVAEIYSIIEACNSRQITIVPLVNRVRNRLGISTKSTFNAIALAKQTDVSFAQQIKNALRKNKWEKISVLVGAAHAEPLQIELRKQGITSKIIPDAFRDRRFLNAILEFDRKIRTAHDKRDEHAVEEHMKNMSALFDNKLKERNVPSDEELKRRWKIRVKEELTKKEAQRKKRIKIRLKKKLK